MNKSVMAITKLNLRTISGAYITTAACVAALLSGYIITAAFSAKWGREIGGIGVSLSWAFLLLPILAGIFVPARNFKRIINLGGKRENFFRACLPTYVILSAATSLAVLIVYYAVDIPYILFGRFGGLFTVADVFGWGSHGPAVFFIRQFAFLFLSAVFAHTLTAMQGKWYGFAADAALIAVICVFPPIEPLRVILAEYFRIILFHPSALLQIAVCVGIGAGLYLLSRFVFARKAV